MSDSWNLKQQAAIEREARSLLADAELRRLLAVACGVERASRRERGDALHMVAELGRAGGEVVAAIVCRAAMLLFEERMADLLAAAAADGTVPDVDAIKRQLAAWKDEP